MAAKSDPTKIRRIASYIRSSIWLLFLFSFFILPRIVSLSSWHAFRLNGTTWERLQTPKEGGDLLLSGKTLWLRASNALYTLDAENWVQRWSFEDGLGKFYKVLPDDQGGLYLNYKNNLVRISDSGSKTDIAATKRTLGFAKSPQGEIFSLEYNDKIEPELLKLNGASFEFLAKHPTKGDEEQLVGSPIIVASEKALFLLLDKIYTLPIDGEPVWSEVKLGSEIPVGVWQLAGQNDGFIWLYRPSTFIDALGSGAARFIKINIKENTASTIDSLPEGAEQLRGAWISGDDALQVLVENGIWKLEGTAWRIVQKPPTDGAEIDLSNSTIVSSAATTVILAEKPLPIIGSINKLLLPAVLLLLVLEIVLSIVSRLLIRKAKKHERQVLHEQIADAPLCEARSLNLGQRSARKAGRTFKLKILPLILGAGIWIYVNSLGIKSDLLAFGIVFAIILLTLTVLYTSYDFIKLRHLRASIRLMREGKYRQALELARNKGGASRVELQEIEGIVEFFKGDTESAQQTFTEICSALQQHHSIEDRGVLASCLAAYARILLLLGKIEQAEAKLEVAESLSDKHFELPLTRAELLLVKKQSPEEALSLLSSAEKKFPLRSYNLILRDKGPLVRIAAARVRAMAELGQFAEAENVLQKAKVIEPSSAVHERVLLGIAEAWLRLRGNNKKQAMDVLYHAANLDPDGFSGKMAASIRRSLGNTSLDTKEGPRVGN